MSRAAPYSIRAAWRALLGEDIYNAKKIGADQYRTFCPVHNDHDPSCDISISKAAWTCRACGAGGGVLDLIIATRNAQTKGEAMQWLREHVPSR